MRRSPIRPAIMELGSLELGDRGMQVHRSYWVATSHVTRSVRSGKRTILRLTGDHKVPVSVTHRPAVRAALGR